MCVCTTTEGTQIQAEIEKGEEKKKTKKEMVGEKYGYL